MSAGQLRYWILCSWTLALATEVRLDWVGIWLAAAVALGLIRGRVDHWAQRLHEPQRKAVLRAVATVSCVAWAAGPLLAWWGGSATGQMLAIGLLAAGYMLVFTQMRAALHEALIVSAPTPRPW